MRLPRRNHNGSALIIGLVLLIVITLLAMSGMRNAIMQERMSMNMLDRNLALQRAESELRRAEDEITNGTATIQDTIDNPFARSTWTSEFGDPGIANFEDTYIEFLGEFCVSRNRVCSGRTDPNWRPVHRITAISTGGTENAVVIIQSTVATR